MIGAQVLLVSWPVSVYLKFLLISTTIVAGLLFVYQVAVRYPVIGTTLNGPRARRPVPIRGRVEIEIAANGNVSKVVVGV